MSEEKRMSYQIDGDEEAQVECDADFPGSVLAILAKRCPFEGRTRVVVDIESCAVGDTRIFVCHENHVHVVLSSELPLFGINITLFVAWSVARALDAVEWKTLPDVNTVTEFINDTCTHVESELPLLVQYMRRKATDLASQVELKPRTEDGRMLH